MHITISIYAMDWTCAGFWMPGSFWPDHIPLLRDSHGKWEEDRVLPETHCPAN